MDWDELDLMDWNELDLMAECEPLGLRDEAWRVTKEIELLRPVVLAAREVVSRAYGTWQPCVDLKLALKEYDERSY